MERRRREREEIGVVGVVGVEVDGEVEVVDAG